MRMCVRCIVSAAGKNVRRHIQKPASDLHQQLLGCKSPPPTLPRPCQVHSCPINTDNASVAPPDLNSPSGQNVAGDQEKVIGTERTVQSHGQVKTV